MILHCSYEESRALARGAEVVLSGDPGSGALLAPPVELAAVEELARRLNGDLSVRTFHEVESMESALEAVTVALRAHMDASVLATHPAGEEAVNAYFDYAHSRMVLERARELKGEMRALIELMTGAPVDEVSARTVSFPD